MVATLLQGATGIVMSKFDPIVLLSSVEKYKVSWTRTTVPFGPELGLLKSYNEKTPR